MAFILKRVGCPNVVLPTRDSPASFMTARPFQATYPLFDVVNNVRVDLLLLLSGKNGRSHKC